MTTPDVYEAPLPDAETVTLVQELAHAAQYAALAFDSDTFVSTFGRLLSEHYVHLAIAFSLWCDHAIEAIEAVSDTLARKDELLASVYRNESERGEHSLWAVRILRARAEGDKDAYFAAITELDPLTRKGKVLRIQTLLAATATAISACRRVAADEMADFSG